jgi:hypothetical protein
MFSLPETPKLPSGRSPTEDTQTLPWNPLNKHSLDKPTSEDVLHAQSPETVILLSELTFK